MKPAEAARRLGVSRGALRRAGLDRALSAEEVLEIRQSKPGWLPREQARQAERANRAGQARRDDPERPPAADAFGAGVDTYLASTGLDYEIDEVVGLGRGDVGIKVGIYPWGKTILEGRKDDVMRGIRGIVSEIRSARLACPSCGTDQEVVEKLAPSQRSAPWQPAFWRCACGTSFAEGALPTDAVAAPGELAGSLTAGGDTLEYVYEGAWALSVLGTDIVAWTPFARPRTLGELGFWPQIEAGLQHLGFESETAASWAYGAQIEETYWNGVVGGIPVVVVSREEWIGPDAQERHLELAANVEGGLTGMFDGLDDEALDELADMWSEFWCNRSPSASGWQLGPCHVTRDWCEYEAVRYIGMEPAFGGPDEAAAWLAHSLADGLAAIRQAEEECLSAFRLSQQRESPPHLRSVHLTRSGKARSTDA